MKKIILLISALVLTHNLSAQNFKNEKKFRIDIQLAQHIGLNDWSDADYVNDGFPGTNMTEIRGVFNLLLGNPHVGAFADIGLGIMPAPRMKSFDPDRMPMPHGGTQYHLREIVSESGSSSSSANVKLTFGFFGRMPVNEKWSVMPYFGVGFLNMPQRRYDVILKEQGSNNQYNATYVWNSMDNEYGSSEALGYLNGRINFNYRLSPKSSLLLGLEYTWFLNSLDFYGSYTNAFNANVRNDFSVSGNNVNMLGLSLGIRFM